MIISAFIVCIAYVFANSTYVSTHKDQLHVHNAQME